MNYHDSRYKHRNLLTKLRNNTLVKAFAVGMTFNMVFTLVAPMLNTSKALTNGPELPETQSFEPVQTTDMVDLFTGDFNYNIPLFNLPGPNGGYPFNLAYHSGIGMDQEATWVGLGWNLTAGSVNRNVRGLPDDFNGDIVTTTSDMLDMHTFGVGVSSNTEVFGADVFNLGLSVRYNNFKGLGYSVSPGVRVFGGSSPNLDLGLSLDSEEGVGVSAQLNLNRSFDKESKELSGGHSVGLGLSFSSSQGLGFNVNWQGNGSKESRATFDGAKNKGRFSGGLGSSISFANTSFNPNYSTPMRNFNLNGNFKTGSGLLGVFNNANVSFLYNTQKMRKDVKGEPKEHAAYGYEHMGIYDNKYDKSLNKKGKTNIIGDFQREKDGLIRKESPNLAIPYNTSDYYNLTGQGAAGAYRSYRNDIGKVYDPYSKSITAGGVFSFDVGPGHLGNSMSVNYGENWSGKWDDQKMDARYGFYDEDPTDSIGENVYQKFHGELTSNAANYYSEFGGDGAVKAYLENRTTTSGTVGLTFGNKITHENPRASRNSGILHLQNSEINNRSEYSIDVFDHSNAGWTYLNPGTYGETFNRSTRNSKSIGHHTGFISTIKPDGMRYNYGLPVYNLKKIENTFSITPNPANPDDTDFAYEACDPTVSIETASGEAIYEHNVSGGEDRSENYHRKVETPPYATSYLLTSVLGADYVDVDNNGPSDKDLGYYVKFSYANYAGAMNNSSYKWRGPFNGANLDMGLHTTHADNKASYMYGEKEVWYMAKAETKTHVAIFHTSPRKDLYEAEGELGDNALTDNDDNATSQGVLSGVKIDSISVYLKSDLAMDGNPETAAPLQRWYFEYDYSLCPDVYNNENNGTGATRSQMGKLTLKKLWVQYRGSSRGSLSPYEFAYKQIDGNGDDIATNFEYGQNNYDRWGNYKPGTLDACDNREFPYVEQFGANGDSNIDETPSQKASFQANADKYAAAWSLGEIKLPTGGTLQIDYEADDYGYVQHKTATQMHKMEKVQNLGSGNEELLYRLGDLAPSFIEDDPRERRVYFRLEEPISDQAYTLTEANQKVYDDYVKDLITDSKGKKQMYVKTYSELRSGIWDYVRGYYELEDFGDITYTPPGGGSSDFPAIGVESGTTIPIDGEDHYTIGFVTIKTLKKKDGTTDFPYHPFAMMAWQHLRTTAPDVLMLPGNLQPAPDGSSKIVKAQKAKELFSWIPAITSLFKDYRKRCRKQGFGRKIDLDKSVVRLCSPDKRKLGGGVRVKRIIYKDNWDLSSNDDASEYGQAYDYTKVENGKTISSGVAQYEPLIGGDEIALRYPKDYPGKVKFFTDNNLFFEYPVNEGLYPGPSIGYSKVTVRSLNTDKTIKQQQAAGVPAAVSTTGETVQEFFTARDFPTISEETSIQKKPLNFDIPIPLVGAISVHELTASQGYSIKTNSMHGTLRSVATYGYDPNNDLINEPLTYVEYHYKHKKRVYQGENVMELDNTVSTLTDRFNKSGAPQDALIEDRLVGVEVDMVTDQRHSSSWYVSAGINSNVDFVGTPIPSVWPSFSSRDTDFRSIVTNKAIHKTGILEKTVATDGQSVVETRNEVFDAQTGRPLLVTVNNNYGDDIYNYSHPAYMEYDGMGAAYRNLGVKFIVEGNLSSPATLVQGSTYAFTTSSIPLEIRNEMAPGDKYLIVHNSQKFQAIFEDFNDDDKPMFEFILQSGQSLNFTTYDTEFKLVRSGRRNHLTVDAGNVIAKSNPLENRTANTCEIDKTIYEGSADVDTYTGTIDDVLHATAVTFNDGWLKDFSEARDDDRNWVDDFDYDNQSRNPFRYGERGIWHPQYSYRYIDDRQQTLDGGGKADPDLKNDGVIDEVPLFNWQSNSFEECHTKWKRLNEITRYNPYSYETENKDITGIYSSALYGFDGSLSTAVAANARQNEIGFESFEEYDVEAPAVINVNNMTTGNIDIYDDYLPSGMSSLSEFRVYDIEGINNGMVVDKPYESGATYDIKLAVHVQPPTSQGEGRRIMFDASVSESQNVSGQTIWTITSGGELYGVVQSANLYYVGQASAKKSISPPVGTNTFDISDEKAHTGKHSMKLSNSVSFHQNRLQLQGGKEYILSLWVARDNARVPTYETANLDIDIAYMNESNGIVAGTAITGSIMKGRIIEGWQQVHIQFEMPSGAEKIQITIDPNVDSGSEDLYVDDMRIYPVTGNINTYVFDNENLRLNAVLDQNNYATIYEYDEQGNLFLTTVETKEGRRTVQENRGHSINQ